MLSVGARGCVSADPTVAWIYFLSLVIIARFWVINLAMAVMAMAYREVGAPNANHATLQPMLLCNSATDVASSLIGPLSVCAGEPAEDRQSEAPDPGRRPADREAEARTGAAEHHPRPQRRPRNREVEPGPRGAVSDNLKAEKNFEYAVHAAETRR
eukprot:1006072-Rhodomonas_salina.2